MSAFTAVAALAACGSAGKTPAAGTTTKVRVKAATDLSATEKLVNWSNWPSYMDVDEKTKGHPTLDAFTKQTGIKVNYTEDYNDNDEFYAKVRPLLEAGTDTGRDAWCSTDWLVARLIRLDYIQKLDLANCTHSPGRASSPESPTTRRQPAARRSRPWTSCSPTRRSRARSLCSPRCATP